MRIKDLISRSKALIEGNVYLAVDDATNNVTQKVDYKTLAQEIIEQYNLSTLAGSAQSVKAALDGLDGNKLDLKAGTAITNGTDVNTLQTPGTYFCASASIAASLSNIPSQATAVGFRLDVARNGYNANNYLTQTLVGVRYGLSFEYVRGMSVQGTWGEWQKTPTRAEVDALNSKTTLEAIPLTANTDVLEISTANTYAIGSLIVFSGWFMFKSDAEIPQGTTLFTIGGNKLFQTRYYMPLCNGRNDFLSALECRESTNVVRARAGFTPVPATYYYLSGACCIK